MNHRSLSEGMATGDRKAIKVAFEDRGRDAVGPGSLRAEDPSSPAPLAWPAPTSKLLVRYGVVKSIDFSTGLEETGGEVSSVPVQALPVA